MGKYSLYLVLPILYQPMKRNLFTVIPKESEGIKQLKKRTLKFILALLACVIMLGGAISLQAEEGDTQYEIYPNPQSISYDKGSYIVHPNVNVVYEDGIDEAAMARMNEVLKIKNIQAVVTDKLVEGKTNILVGTKGSEGYVDHYTEENYTPGTPDLFQKKDSYFLASDKGVITILGADTDAAFYGITTLYHIFNQMESYSIRNFTIEDYGDVASRGFIEGYYGNPWSTEDRAALMKWGGYYKLNSYFYAPKDDPKHNGKWRELYTPEEIETKIKPLAKAGNESKCRFVFALHPYMNNPIRYNSEANYKADLKVMQDKFAQVIEAGVRQIAILADDAGNVGGDNYIKTLNDMTAWLKEMQKTYPDLKITLPFCTQEYMYNGEAYYSQFPENVQIVMTGGRVWGEVSTSFTNTFTQNVGRGPYLWINWPCTDNSKKHLIMGGYSTFLHPGVNPEKIQGIVLNPMQQSEPSKVAIFGNASYSWNIWESEEEAEQTWNDSFKYVDHNTPIETPGSNALRELSKHMINQDMDGRVTELQESVKLKGKLNEFKELMSLGGAINDEIIADLIKEFTVLKDAAVTYRNQSGDTRVRDQIVHWLNCWDDTTTSAISYLNAMKASASGNTTVLMNEYTNGQKYFSKSKTYGFHYVDHTEYAEVGVQHIVPFIKAMEAYLSKKVAEIADPNVITKTFISNRFKTPSSGEFSNVFDSDDSTYVQFQNPNEILMDDYIGVQFNRGITVESIRVLMGGGKNHFYHSKLEYTIDGTTWSEVSPDIYSRPKGSEEPIEIKGLNLDNVTGIRLKTTENNGDDSWLMVHSIDINRKDTGTAGDTSNLFTNVVTDILSNVNEAGDEASLTPGSVTLGRDEYIGLKLDHIKELKQVLVNIDSNSTDLKLQLSTNTLAWTEITDSNTTADARYVRLINTGNTSISLQISQFKVVSKEIGKRKLHDSNVPVTSGWGDTRNNGLAFDGDMATTTKLGGNPGNGQYAIFDLGQTLDVKSLRTYVADSQVDFIRDAKFQISHDLSGWTDVFEIGDGVTDTDRDSPVRNSDAFQNTDSNYPNMLYEGADSLDLTGRYIRILFTADFPTRAVVINEIVINNGAYTPVENNKDYDGALEERGHHPSLMGDGNLSTTYKSVEKNAGITYFVSAPDGLKAFRILQSGSAGNTTVKAVFRNIATGADQEVDVGILNQAINEFLVPDGEVLISIRIEWQEEIPEISEIILLKSADTIDKTALEAKVTEVKDTDTSGWTTSSAEKFQMALAVAQEVLRNSYASQESINGAYGSLEDAHNSKVELYDAGDLKNLVDAAVSNEKGIYSSSTFAKYSYALADAKTALANQENLSVEKGTAVFTALSESLNGLQYSVGNRELGQVALEQASRHEEQNYTVKSYQAVTDAKTALNALIETDLQGSTTLTENPVTPLQRPELRANERTRVHPEEMAKATEALNQAMNHLVDVTELKSLITAFDTVDKTLYSIETYEAYEQAVNDGKGLLVDGEKDTVTQAVLAITAAKSALKFNSAVNLETAIKAAQAIKGEDHTKVSFQALQKTIEDASAITGLDDQENKEHIGRINKAMNELVSIVGLNVKLEEIAKLDLSKYTKPSVDNLNQILKNADKVKEDGTSAEVTKVIEDLGKAVSALALTADEMEEYRSEMKLITDKELYEEDSYNTYKKTYDALMALPDDTSYSLFIQAKQDYETALSNLTYKEADYSSVESAKKKVPSDLSIYTNETVAKLKEALNSVVYGLKIVDQEKVDQYAKQILDAINGLVKKQFVDTTKPNGDGTSSGESGKPQGNKPDSSNAVQTGDDTAIMMYVFLTLLSTVSILIYRKKKIAG